MWASSCSWVWYTVGSVNKWMNEQPSIVLSCCRNLFLILPGKYLRWLVLGTGLSSLLNTPMAFRPPERQWTASHPARTLFPRHLESGPVYLSLTMETDVLFVLTVSPTDPSEMLPAVQRQCWFPEQGGLCHVHASTQDIAIPGCRAHPLQELLHC